MPKRKRDDLDADNADSAVHAYPDKKTAKQVKKLYGVIESTAKVLHTALRTARGFERQKLGRRIKQARSSNNRQQWNRLEDEVVVLKSLDLSLISQRHVFKTLQKIKRIAEHPAFKQLRVSDSLAAPPATTEEANVTARLYNSNPVKNALPDFVKEVKKLLDVTDSNNGSRVTREQASSGNGEVKEDRGVETVGENSSRDDEQEQAWKALESRLASSSSADSDTDGGETRDAALADADDILLPPPDSDDAGDSDDSSDGNADTRPGIAENGSAKTTFLPSLAMGGYWSGSESEAEDDLPELGGGRNGKPLRKNRMGQQARRALWEKKFGKEANHVKKGQAATTKRSGKRDEGWDLRRGATDGVAGKGSTARRDRGDGGNQERKGREPAAARRQGKEGQRPPHKTIDDKPVHPSWEAKRKAKEAMQAKLSSFQGKKITFD